MDTGNSHSKMTSEVDSAGPAAGPEHCVSGLKGNRMKAHALPVSMQF